MNPASLLSQLRCALSGCGPHRWFSGRWASEASPLPPRNSWLLECLGVLGNSRLLMVAFGTLQVHSTDATFALLSDMWPRKPSSAWLLTLASSHLMLSPQLFHYSSIIHCNMFYKTDFMLPGLNNAQRVICILCERSSWRSLPFFLITSSHNRDIFCINVCSRLLFI